MVMTPVYAYLRVSGKGQVAGDGFPRQEKAVREYCAGNGLEVAHVYRERGVSGTVDGMDRPTWVEMVGEILADGVKTIVIERLDRLARDLMIQEHIVADLARRGITLISAAEPDLCRDDPTRTLLRQIMGAIAQYDKRMVVLKLRGARQRAKARGERCEGAKPYGELEGEAEVLFTMKDLRSADISFAAIANTLNQTGRKPRRGMKWHPHAVARILKRVSI